MDGDLTAVRVSLRLGDVYGDAWRIYRLLFRRSVLTAAIVFGVLALVRIGGDAQGSRGVAIALGVLASILDWAAPVIVQGALIEIVRDIHEGRPAKRIGALYNRARARFWPLFWASLLYAFGFIFGLLVLVVPGLYVFARWALMAPFVVLDDAGVSEARRRSSQTVEGFTVPVLGVVAVVFLLLTVPFDLTFFFVLGGGLDWILFSFAWNALTAPFEAHVLTVLYYRLTDPERPVVDADVFRWRSVWEGA